MWCESRNGLQSRQILHRRETDARATKMSGLPRADAIVAIQQHACRESASERFVLSTQCVDILGGLTKVSRVVLDASKMRVKFSPLSARD
jgi:hypothetical protein